MRLQDSAEVTPEHQQLLVHILVAVVEDLIPRKRYDFEGHDDDTVDMPRASLLALAGTAATLKQAAHNVRVERMPTPLKFLCITAVVGGGDSELEAPAKAPLLHELADIELKCEGRAALRCRYAGL